MLKTFCHCFSFITVPEGLTLDIQNKVDIRNLVNRVQEQAIFFVKNCLKLLLYRGEVERNGKMEKFHPSPPIDEVDARNCPRIFSCVFRNSVSSFIRLTFYLRSNVTGPAWRGSLVQCFLGRGPLELWPRGQVLKLPPNTEPITLRGPSSLPETNSFHSIYVCIVLPWSFCYNWSQ